MAFDEIKLHRTIWYDRLKQRERMGKHMQIRPYMPSDSPTAAALFYTTIQTANAKGYALAELAA